MFPGVGSHYTTMGKYFYDNFKVAKETFEEASDTLHIDFEKLCFSPDEKESLDKLENSQTTLVCVSTAMFRVYMKEIGIKPMYCLGYSLGEVSALCCAGAIDYSAALQIVRDRGLIISDVASRLDGTMAWTINLEQNIIDNICEDLRAEGEKIYTSAYDTPIKTSISGTSTAVNKACNIIVEKGGIGIPIKMSGPFHSPLMIEASLRFKHILEKYQYRDFDFPVISNVTALPYNSKDEIIDSLTLQLIKPIGWQSSINYLIQKGIDKGIEMGPKNVLKYLVEKISNKLTVYAFEKEKELKIIKDDLIINESDILKILGKCLASVVSTKNRNDNNEHYQDCVVKLYNEILRLYDEIASGKIEPAIESVKVAVDKLEAILKYKMLSQIEQNYQLQKVLGGKFLKMK